MTYFTISTGQRSRHSVNGFSTQGLSVWNERISWAAPGPPARVAVGTIQFLPWGPGGFSQLWKAALGFRKSLSGPCHLASSIFKASSNHHQKPLPHLHFLFQEEPGLFLRHIWLGQPYREDSPFPNVNCAIEHNPIPGVACTSSYSHSRGGDYTGCEHPMGGFLGTIWEFSLPHITSDSSASPWAAGTTPFLSPALQEHVSGRLRRSSLCSPAKPVCPFRWSDWHQVMRVTQKIH